MIDLDIQGNTLANSYINSGNLFSKSLLLKQWSKNKKTLFIVASESLLSHYKLLFDFLKINYIHVSDLASLVEAHQNTIGFYILTKETLHMSLLNEYKLSQKQIVFEQGETFSQNDCITRLNILGYSFSDFRKKGSYKKLGDTLHVYPSFSEISYYRVSFFDDEVEKIEQVFSNTIIEKEELTLGGIEPLELSISDQPNESFCKYIANNDTHVYGDGLDFYAHKQDFQDFFSQCVFFDAIKNTQKQSENIGIHELYIQDLSELTHFLQDTAYQNKHIFTKNKITLDNFLRYNNITGIHVHECRVKNIGSFYTDIHNAYKTLIIADDNLDRVFVKKRIKRSFSDDMNLLIHIKAGDYITHIDHGVGIFKGIIKRELNIGGKKLIKEYLELEYLDGDKLYVPITEVKRVSKYIGKENPKLTGLSTKEWSKKLKKVGEEVEDIAEELLEIFAKRNLKEGFIFKKDIKKIDAFQSSFPYSYTNDQEQAIEEILDDMESVHPMDRLLNGDVGFGKTEVCFNAIFNAYCNKKQSILLTPLVVLAYEHYEKAIERFESFGMKVGVLTRFEKAARVTQTLEALKAGKIDLVVGTHKLLSKDVVFKDLGLVVIDEEHKFGVKDKEKIKELKGQIDILSLSATPIPRSLNMALNGLKQVSILKTPPYGRKPIETYVSRFSDEVIIDACRHEFERDGQVFFIHNRVQNIESFKNYLQVLFPHKSIVVTHGQLHGDDLEKRIIAFRKKEYDILLSTTVIENGIDFPNVNTIFINDAYKFGISQIHQLRGRVGRSEKQGYCYLLYRNENINAEAEKRLKTIVDYSHLGAGFELAMRDLEVRGGGEILGKKQSGQVAEVGISIFIEMLETKITELKRIQEFKAKKALPDMEKQVLDEKLSINTTIDLNISAYIPDSFFGSSMDKMNFYRELETVSSKDDLATIIADFKQTNSELPAETQNLFSLLDLKYIAADFNIGSIKRVGQNYQLDFESAQGEELKIMRKFLDLDKEVRFVVADLKRLRTPIKKYGSDLGFMQYMLDMLTSKKISKKFKLKK